MSNFFTGGADSTGPVARDTRRGVPILRPKLISAIVLAVTVLCARTTGQPSRVTMSHPVFGIVYDPEKVHFEPLPATLARKCVDLRGHYVNAWIFGFLKTADSEFFLISGLVRYRNQVTGAPVGIGPDEYGGLAVEVHGQKCTVADSDDLFLAFVATGEHPFTGLNQSVLDGISRDVIDRAAQAFGGRKKFLDRIDGKDLGPGVLGPNLARQLHLFEQQRPARLKAPKWNSRQ